MFSSLGSDILKPLQLPVDAVGPAQFADGLITLSIIDQILDVDLHRWTPVRGWKLRCLQFTPSSHSTTLESNKIATRSRTNSCYPLDQGDNLVFCHQYPTKTCGPGNLAV
jgi:hypothetical protein